MTTQSLCVGDGRYPVVVVDTATGVPDEIIDIAAGLAPFPRGPNPNYPGVRRVIGDRDPRALDYVSTLLETCAPAITAAFDCARFELLEASFSIVTTPPAVLKPQQRIPHFDATDPNYLAVMHYLGDVAMSGTAFFRQRATGIEAVSDDNIESFIADARTAAMGLDGYFADGDAGFDEIGRVDGKRDRVVIYQGALLHSGIIPRDMPLDPDPRRGRLTANIFVQIR